MNEFNNCLLDREGCDCKQKPCASCGFDKRENERRLQIKPVKMEDGLCRKIIKK